jgi:hypothetical protein
VQPFAFSSLRIGNSFFFVLLIVSIFALSAIFYPG